MNSDLVFGLVSLLGGQYRPALADIPDKKGWRVSAAADYGALSTFARGKIDLAQVRAHWHDILRVVESLQTAEPGVVVARALATTSGLRLNLGPVDCARHDGIPPCA